AALFLDGLHQHHLAALDDFLDLVLPAIARQPLLHLFERVAANRIDDFLLDYVGSSAVGLAGCRFSSDFRDLGLGRFRRIGCFRRSMHGLGVLVLMTVVVIVMMIAVVLVVVVMLILVMLILATF